MSDAVNSDWGRLFQNWEKLTPDDRGFPDVGTEPLVVQRSGVGAAARSLGVLGTCIKEAPEFKSKKPAKS